MHLTHPALTRRHFLASTTGGVGSMALAWLLNEERLLAEPALATYGYLSAARADLFRRLGRWTEAAAAYEEALALTDNDIEREFLLRRLVEVRNHLGPG